MSRHHRKRTRLVKMLPLVPIVARMGGAIGTGLVSTIPMARRRARSLRRQANRRWDEAMEDLQGFYFDNPWFMVTFVRAFSNVALAGNLTVRAALTGLQAFQYSQRRDIVLDSLPTSGYRAFMTAYLTIGTAMGYFRGGPVHVRLIRRNDYLLSVNNVSPFDPPRKRKRNVEVGLWPEDESTTVTPEQAAAAALADSTMTETEAASERAKQQVLRNPTVISAIDRYSKQARFTLHRVEPPHSLAETIMDLDDLYWSSAAGMVMKVIAVGTFPNYRWIVIAPGTDHMAAVTIANPADTESNLREMLDLRSAARAGVERAINAAMETLKVPKNLRSQQQILMVGHSQSGVTAHALAHDPLYEARITHVFTIGSPSRAIPVPSSVRSVSVEHVQDCIPWIDGVTEEQIDSRVIVRRSLDKPRRNPLHYAHSAATYLDTVKLMERETARTYRLYRAGKGRLDRVTKEVMALQSVLPQPGESTEVLFYEIAQEILEWAPPTQDREGWISHLVPDADAMVAALVERAVFDPAGAPQKLGEDALEALEWASQIKQSRLSVLSEKPKLDSAPAPAPDPIPGDPA